MKHWLLAAIAAAVLSGCSSTPSKEQPGATVEERKPDAVVAAKPPVEPVKPIPPSKPVPPPVVVTPVQPSTVTGNPLTDPKNILSRRSIYFDFDSNAVKDEFKPLVTAHAKFLTDNRGRKAIIQGNTDERGSREYNLALGQRRADAVKRMMMLLGVADAQVEAVSFGEEKPRAQGKDEAAYAENRRSDIVHDGD